MNNTWLGILTPQNLAVLRFVAQRIIDSQAPPTIRDIGNDRGMRSPNAVVGHLRRLAEFGYLNVGFKSARSLTLVGCRYGLSYENDANNQLAMVLAGRMGCLSERQHKLLLYLVSCIKKGRPATRRMIMTYMGHSGPNGATQMIEGLIRKGFIDRLEKTSCGVRVKGCRLVRVYTDDEAGLRLKAVLEPSIEDSVVE